VALDVVHRDQRHAQPIGERLRSKDPTSSASDRPGPAVRDSVERVEARPRARQRGAHRRVEVPHAVAARQLGDHAAVGRVDLVLALHDRGEDLAAAAHDGRGQVVAGGLDREDQRHGPILAPPALRGA
jgi:hypothetical protein